MKTNCKEIFYCTRNIHLDLKKQYRKQYYPVNDQAKLGHRIVSKIANVANKVLVAIAYAVATVAVGIFDLASFPIRLVIKRQKLKNYFSTEELKAMSNAERYRIWDRIKEIIESKNLQISSQELTNAKEEALVSYARSSQYFKPVAIQWVDFLLKKASEESKKLVFLARDGSAPRKLAFNMLEKNPERYPNITKEDMPLAYFSRKVIIDCKQRGEEGKKDINDYMRQLGIEKGTECIFVDIGFQGSMIENLISLLDDYPISFEYFISHTRNAHGFFGTHLRDLMSVKIGDAGGNKAVHWLEDSHQGAIFSPSKLIRTDGGVYPNTRTPSGKQTYRHNPSLETPKARSKSHTQYLIRKLSKEAIVKINKYTPKLDALALKKDETFIELDSFLLKIKNGVLPLHVNHN